MAAMRACRTFLLLLLAAALAPAQWSWEDVRAFRFSEGRQEQIPSLTGTLHNESGQDWDEAAFRVSLPCPDGPHSYQLTLRGVGLLPLAVNATAYDWIGRVTPCAAQPEVAFVNGTPAVSSYVVLGFSFEEDGGPLSTQLAAVLEHRRPEGQPSFTERVEARFLARSEGPEPVAFYVFRTLPGEFGLAGFLLTARPDEKSVLQRYLRLFDLPPATVSWLGCYRVRRAGQEASVVYEQAQAAWDSLKIRFRGWRTAVASGRRPAIQGAFTVGR
jgi:hypothetical protein